jgi:hypothetical protein
MYSWVNKTKRKVIIILIHEECDMSPYHIRCVSAFGMHYVENSDEQSLTSHSCVKNSQACIDVLWKSRFDALHCSRPTEIFVSIKSLSWTLCEWGYTRAKLLFNICGAYSGRPTPPLVEEDIIISKQITVLAQTTHLVMDC